MADLLTPKARQPAQRPAPPPVPSSASEGKAAIPPNGIDHPGMKNAPKNGVVVVVHGNDGQHALAYWRKTKAMDFKTRKWSETGFWCIAYTSMRLDFDPRTWNERKSSWDMGDA